MSSDFGRGRLQTDSPQRHLEPLKKYRETVFRLFPGSGKRVLEDCPVFTADALFLGYFLDYYPRWAVALEASACAGASAFWLASHPKVSRVVSVNPNLPIAEARAEHPGPRREEGDESPPDLRPLDIASAVLDEHPEERGKITFLEGQVGDVPVEMMNSPEGNGLVMLMCCPGTREDVSEGLTAVFDLNPRAVVFLGNCRRERGPFVQAGVVDFLGSSQAGHHFRLVADLGPAMASSGIGIVYPSSVAAEVEGTLGEVDRIFSRKLDPLRLLGREEELMGVVGELNRQLSERAEREQRLKDAHEAHLREQTSWLEKKVSRLETRVANLQARNAQLRSQYSSRRYRLADALVEKALRVPAIKKLWLKYAPPSGEG